MGRCESLPVVDSRRLAVLMRIDLQVYSISQALEGILYTFWRESIGIQCCKRSEYMSVSIANIVRLCLHRGTGTR